MIGFKPSAFVGFLLAFVFSCPALAQNPPALLLFGGEAHKTFLGCLNCTPTSSGSVCNEYGKEGSQYQNESIWNAYGRFGSEYSEFSPWNAYTTKAPIIVDKDGNSYGYFSANAYHKDRTRIKWLLSILDFNKDENDLEATRKAMCNEE
jgi:hypothetical protein